MKRVWLIALVAAAGWAQTAVKPQATPNASPAAPPPTQSGAATQAATASQAAQTAAAQASAATQATATSQAAATSKSTMAAAIEQQKASVQMQVQALTGQAAPAASSFFTVPWVGASLQSAAQIAYNAPPCDPMPNEQLDLLITQSAQREGVETELIRAVIGEESGSRPCAVSPKGAQGLMQLMPATVEQFGVRDPFDPKENVDAGTKLLKQLLTKYGGDVRRALSAYNAGSDRVDKEGGVPQIPETINYVNDILSKLPNH
jgi:soluble lytic murein transglycosylase-like protein